jgi:teichuronic acid biosynthesis glycosyltransferase TuaG
MNAQPLVSVVIPTYNYARYVGETVQSIFAQSYPNLEVIVIDDGSTDETLNVLKDLADDKRLIVHTQSNQGCTNATNNGFKLSKGNYFAVCGSDDVWNRDHIRLLVDALQRHREAGLAFDNAEYFYNDSASSGCGLVVPGAIARELKDKIVPLQDVFERNWITACSFLVRREVLDQVGLFDPTLYLTGDLHLMYRIAAYYPICFVDYLGVRVRIHGQNMSVVKRHYEFGVKSLEDIQKNYPGVLEKIGRRTFARKLGRKYYRLGRYYERLGRLDEAREAYRKAFVCRKTRPRYYWSYFRVSSRRSINRWTPGG